jgi:hypothetical protein
LDFLLREKETSSVETIAVSLYSFCNSIGADG